MTIPPDVLLREVITEFIEMGSAFRAGLVAVAEQPPNMERLAAAMQRIEDAEDALREMRDQEVTE